MVARLTERLGQRDVKETPKAGQVEQVRKIFGEPYDVLQLLGDCVQERVLAYWRRERERQLLEQQPVLSRVKERGQLAVKLRKAVWRKFVDELLGDAGKHLAS